jgi:sigma-E factor negative regulatory protein RseC
MNSSKSIEHKGIIEDINGPDIKVLIEATSACSSCHAKGVCGAADMKEKRIDIQHASEVFTIGEQVRVLMNQSNGFKALILGYIIPLVIVVILLFAMIAFTNNEAIAGLVSIGALIPYYVSLYLLKQKIKRQLHFTLAKIN